LAILPSPTKHEGTGDHVPGGRLARDFGCVLTSADDIKFMIMTAGGVSDPYCHPLATPMS